MDYIPQTNRLKKFYFLVTFNSNIDHSILFVSFFLLVGVALPPVHPQGRPFVGVEDAGYLPPIIPGTVPPVPVLLVIRS